MERKVELATYLIPWAKPILMASYYMSLKKLLELKTKLEIL